MLFGAPESRWKPRGCVQGSSGARWTCTRACTNAQRTSAGALGCSAVSALPASLAPLRGSSPSMAERVASAPSAAWHNGLTPNKGPQNQTGPAPPPTRLVALATSPFEACGFGLAKLWASNVPEGATQVGACPGRAGSDALGPAPSGEGSRPVPCLLWAFVLSSLM